MMEILGMTDDEVVRQTRQKVMREGGLTLEDMEKIQAMLKRAKTREKNLIEQMKVEREGEVVLAQMVKYVFYGFVGVVGLVAVLWLVVWSAQILGKTW
jgi:DNA polymerase III delta prime subunit